MNIFYTDNDPVIAARQHCRVHMRKMIVEYAQLLSAAHHVLDGGKAIDGLYKLSHKNHPCAVWIRKSSEHYNWLHKCAMELCEMYRKDSGKVHKTESVLKTLIKHPTNIGNTKFSKPPCCTDDKLKMACILGKPITECYQQYIINKHVDWNQRGIDTSFVETPSWYN